MAHPSIERRCNQKFPVKIYLGNDGEDDVLSEPIDFYGFMAYEEKVILGFDKSTVTSSTQIYLTTKNPKVLDICGGSRIILDTLGDVPILGIQKYQAKPSRNNKAKIGLLVLYI